MKALSLDLRERIVAALESGQRRAQIAARFAVSESSLYRFQRQWKRSGDLSPQKRPGRGRALKEDDLAVLETLLTQQQDPTLSSLVAAWQEISGKHVSLATMHRALRRLTMSFKKSAVSPANATKPSGTPSGQK